MSVFWAKCLILLLFVFSSSIDVTALAVSWFDDFDDRNVHDGNPVTWTENYGNNFPGTYDASTGDYHLSDAQNVGNNPGTMASFVDGVSFTDTYVRAQGVLLPGSLSGNYAGHLGLLGRINTTAVAAYVLVLDPFGEMSLQFADNRGVPTTFATVNLTGTDAANDVIIELDIVTHIVADNVENVLNGYAWRPGSPKPATPQITASDSGLYAPFLTQGPAGIVYSEFSGVDDTSAVYRFVGAQDMPFVDGDYNNNGAVDAADYVVWRKNGGAASAYDTWRANFGNASIDNAFGSNTNVKHVLVPEPTITFHLLLVLLLSARRCRRVNYVATAIPFDVGHPSNI